ncbi:hypothetical protein CAEBREN_03880 [Caenorhabditis brenneri]|uniref:Homeobox-cysteine loop-homeobox domain-containing protein n=1 Tax=Caenorhabditis brenneri TaxID=135651 RepID=G0P7S8_CAEBE|nr:hypothetical protein CAEBREN_03880 [Caenorhabditis brenneri]
MVPFKPSDRNRRTNQDEAEGSYRYELRKSNQKYLDEDYSLDDYERNNELNVESSTAFYNHPDAKENSDDTSEYAPSDDETLANYPLRKPSYCVKVAIADLFSRNPHPSVSEMNELTEFYSVKYRTIFETMELKRNSQQIICNRGDNCERIREYFRQQSVEPYASPTIPPDVKQLLETLIENQLFTRKRFELGYVHMVMEKTNLPFGAVRSSYAKWRRRLLSSGIPGYTIEAWRHDHRHAHLHAKVFTHDSIRKMEVAYLKKKYESENKEWTDEEFASLSTQLGNIPVDKIAAWFQDRNTVALDSSYLDPDPPEAHLTKCQPWNAFRIPVNKIKCLKEMYTRNPHPSNLEFQRIAEIWGIEEITVRRFYQRNRGISKRKMELEEAKCEIDKLEADKFEMLETVAADKKKKKAAELVELAETIGISYRSLRTFIDWKKSLKKKK